MGNFMQYVFVVGTVGVFSLTLILLASISVGQDSGLLWFGTILSWVLCWGSYWWLRSNDIRI